MIAVQFFRADGLYLSESTTCIEKKQVICPKLDLNKWGNAKHFYDQQLKEKSFEEKKIELVKASLKKLFLSQELIRVK